MDNTDNDKIVSVLNELIETCEDGAKGFATASEGAENLQLKSLFAKYSSQRGSFAADLEGQVRSLGSEPVDRGHVSGAVHRGWINLKAAVTGNDDKTILNECERGEDHAKKAYTDALKENLPADVRTIVQRQSIEVQVAHDKIRDLRNAANDEHGKDGHGNDTSDIVMPIGKPAYHE